MTSSILSIEQLRERLNYDPATGFFTWRSISKYQPKEMLGARAGYPTAGRYRAIEIGNKAYSEHRLAWAFVHDAWPEGDIDHKNGDGSCNWIDNLRDGSTSFNCQNRRGPGASNTSGYLGVSAAGRKWKAQIKLPRRTKVLYLGVHATPELAYAVYLDAKRQHHAGNTL